MPHVNSSGGDDLASTDEVKVYKDEGDEEKRSSENLSEDKLGLVTESEEGKSSDIEGRSYPDEKPSSVPQDGKGPENPLFSGDRPGVPFGYPMITPYPFPNGATVGHLGSKVLPSPGLSPFYMYNNDHFSPPPAHMGIPPVHIDPKTGLPRHMYSLPHPAGQFPHPLYPELSQVQWSSAGYPISASGLRGPYPTSLSSSPLSRFSPPGILSHPGLHHLPHPAIITPGPKQDIGMLINGDSHRQNYIYGNCNGSTANPEPNRSSAKKIPHVKRPLNAFMLFMKERRQTVIEECKLKESAAINQILGRKWHALDRSEQAKYYEMARKEKELHQQLYPGWSARDNYATHNKKKNKRKREHCGNGENKGWLNDNHSSGSMEDDCANAKKCRARFGLDQQNQWCKPCRRKKKCIRFMEDGGMNSNGEDDDDDDDQIPSVDTVHSTTEGESELGSPSTTTHIDEHRHQHPEVSQSGQGHSPVTKAPATSTELIDVSRFGHLPHVLPYPPLPPLPALHRPVPIREGMLPPQTSLPVEPPSGPHSLSAPNASVSSSTMVLAT